MTTKKTQTANGGGSFLDLRSQFIFYASYHNESVNVAIHLFCIWQLIGTLLALLQYTPELMGTPEALTDLPLVAGLKINLSLVVTIVYIVCYMAMDPIVGGIGSLLMLALHVGTGQLVDKWPTIGGWPMWQVVVAYHVLLWIMQFVGHGAFEKRAPALLDSWQQAFITAPLFVLLEVFFYFGYRKQFYDECMYQVKINLEEFKKEK